MQRRRPAAKAAHVVVKPKGPRSVASVVADFPDEVALFRDEMDFQRILVKRLMLLHTRIASLKVVEAPDAERLEEYELILRDVQSKVRESQAAQKEVIDWLLSRL